MHATYFPPFCFTVISSSSFFLKAAVLGTLQVQEARVEAEQGSVALQWEM